MAQRLTSDPDWGYNACYDDSAISQYLSLLDEAFQDLLNNLSH